MARKIIPLKYKKSPMLSKFWNTLGDISTIGLFDFAGKGTTSLEDQFAGMKQDLMDTDVSKNFYADLVNPYAGLTDHMAGLENTAEDLTINQRQFQQQERSLQRSLSTALEQSKRTGTQSAQAIANQLSQASGDMAAGIGEQERQNQLMKAQQAGELQKLKAESAQALESKKAEGEFQVDMQMRKGEEDALSRQLNKQQALLSLVSGEIARADQKEKDEKGWLSKVLNIF